MTSRMTSTAVSDTTSRMTSTTVSDKFPINARDWSFDNCSFNTRVPRVILNESGNWHTDVSVNIDCTTPSEKHWAYKQVANLRCENTENSKDKDGNIIVKVTGCGDEGNFIAIRCYGSSLSIYLENVNVCLLDASEMTDIIDFRSYEPYQTNRSQPTVFRTRACNDECDRMKEKWPNTYIDNSKQLRWSKESPKYITYDVKYMLYVADIIMTRGNHPTIYSNYHFSYRVPYRNLNCLDSSLECNSEFNLDYKHCWDEQDDDYIKLHKLTRQYGCFQT